VSGYRGLSESIIADADICLSAIETDRDIDYLNDLGAKIKELNKASRAAFSQALFVAVIMVFVVTLAWTGAFQDQWWALTPESVMCGLGILVALLARAGIAANRATEAQFYFLTKCLDRQIVGTLKLPGPR
jgi:uncharacterized ion transporter superfamily protein YfcC